MLAQLVLVVVVLVVGGTKVPVGIQLPMPDMIACQKWLADPTPILITGAKPISAICVDKPIGKDRPA